MGFLRLTRNPPSDISAPQLVLASSSSTPGLTFNFVTMPNVGDVLSIYDGANFIGSYTLTQTDIDNGGFALGLSALASGSHSLSAIQGRGTPQSSFSNTISLTV